MAFSVKLITVTEPTSTTGNVAVTGVGLGVAAQALLLFSAPSSSVGAASDYGIMVGAATASGTDNQWVDFNMSINGATSNQAAVVFDNTKCIRYLDNTGTTLNSAAFTSFDGSDGNFTLNWSNSVTSAFKIHVLVIGGATNVKAGNFQRPAASGSQNVTTGFTSTDNNGVVLFASGLNDSSAPPHIGVRVWSNFGAATSGSQRAGSMANLAGNSPSLAFHWQLAKPVLMSSGQSEGDFSWDGSNGFNINWTISAGQQGYIGYLAINGGKHYITQTNQRTTAGTTAFTSTGVDPIGGVFWSAGSVTDASRTQAFARLSIGGATSSSNMFSLWGGIKDNVSTTDTSRDYSTTALLKMMTEAGASPTTQAVAEYVSNDAGGATINWSTADGTAREYNVWLFGAGAAAVDPTIRNTRFNYFDYRG